MHAWPFLSRRSTVVGSIINWRWSIWPWDRLKVMVHGMTNRRCAWTRDRSSKDRGGSVGTITAVSWLQSKCACCFFSFSPPSFFSRSIRVIRECWAQCRWSPSQNNSEKEKLFIMGTYPTPIACTNPQPRTVEMPVGPFHISSYL